MALTLEQITAEVSAQPEVKKALIGSLKNDFLEGLKAEGVTVRTKDEETQYLTNYENNVIPEKVKAQIGDRISELHKQYDEDIFEITGLRKGANEKTYEFNKRLLRDLKEKAEKAAKGGDPVQADKIKDLETKLKERENYVAPDEVEKMKGKYFSEHVGLRLAGALEKKTIAVPAHITDEKAKQQFIETQRRFIRNDFQSRFIAKHDEKGNIVFYEGEQILTDGKTAAPKTEEQLISEHYNSYFVPEKKAQGGAGSGKGSQQEHDTEEASLKTKDDVIKHLDKKLGSEGIKQGSAKYTSEYERIIKDYAIVD